MSFFNDIIIGNYTSIAMGVKILDYNHRVSSISTSRIQKLMNIDLKSDYNSKGQIVIGNDVWIGMDCNILSGVTLGNGCVISSNSTVTKNVEPYSIVGGSPARVLKMRFSEDIIEILQKIQWWNYDLDELIPYQNIFRKDKLSLEDVKLLQVELRNNL
jgi:virginiamycin A acetyltransferase